MRGEGSVAGEGRVVGLPKFYSWASRTMPLTNINSDWMSNASSGLRIIAERFSARLLILQCVFSVGRVLWP